MDAGINVIDTSDVYSQGESEVIVEADLLPVAERYGMGMLPWSPLAGGWL